MRTVLVIFAFALLALAACGGTESSDNVDTSLTIDEVVGIWRIDAVDLLKDTCKFPDMDTQEEVGSYSYLEKADATHMNVYGCEDAACASKVDMQTFAYSKGKMTVPGEETDIAIAGTCRVYMLVPQTYAVFSSASAASMTFGGTVKFEGDCTAVKATPVSDPNDPDKVMGDYEGCQVSIKRVMSKQ